MKRVCACATAVVLMALLSCVSAVYAQPVSVGAPAGAFIELKALQTIRLNKKTATLRVGDMLTLRAAVKPLGSTVTYTSSKPTVATVDEKTGRVTAVGTGKATIVARLESGKSAKCTITVKHVPVKKVTLGQNSAKLTAGDTLALNATVTPASAAYRTIRWSSSNESVAAVDQSGKVTTLKAGSATITASVGGRKAACRLMVSRAPSIPPTNSASPYYGALIALRNQVGLAPRSFRADENQYEGGGLVSALTLDMDANGRDEMIVLTIEDAYNSYGDKESVLMLKLYTLDANNAPVLAQTMVLENALGYATQMINDLYVFTKNNRDYLYFEEAAGVEGYARIYAIISMKNGRLVCPVLISDPGYTDGLLLEKHAANVQTDSLCEYVLRRQGRGVKLYGISSAGRKSGKYSSYGAALKGTLGTYGLKSFSKYFYKAAVPSTFRAVMKVEGSVDWDTYSGSFLITDYTGLQ